MSTGGGNSATDVRKRKRTAAVSAQASANALIRKQATKIIHLEEKLAKAVAQKDALLSAGQLPNRESAVIASLRLYAAACFEANDDYHWGNHALVAANWHDDESRAILERGAAGRLLQLRSLSDEEFGQLSLRQLRSKSKAARPEATEKEAMLPLKTQPRSNPSRAASLASVPVTTLPFQVLLM